MSLRSVREKIVREHVDAEAAGEWDAALRTFGQPKYEIMATGEIFDGAEAVARFYAETALAFPKVDFEDTRMHHADAGVIVETVFRAVHGGPWRGLPATGREVRYAMSNLFVFEGDVLVCERMYFDLMTPLRQIGIARDPTSTIGRVATALNHPVVVGSAFVRGLFR